MVVKSLVAATTQAYTGQRFVLNLHQIARRLPRNPLTVHEPILHDDSTISDQFILRMQMVTGLEMPANSFT